MQLKYLKYAGKTHYVYMGEGGKPYPFTPIGELPDGYAKHLLKHFPNDYMVYVQEVEKVTEQTEEPAEEPKFKCDLCDYEATSNAGLSAHKRFKHKEK